MDDTLAAPVAPGGRKRSPLGTRPPIEWRSSIPSPPETLPTPSPHLSSNESTFVEATDPATASSSSTASSPDVDPKSVYIAASTKRRRVRIQSSESETETSADDTPVTGPSSFNPISASKLQAIRDDYIASPPVQSGIMSCANCRVKKWRCERGVPCSNCTQRSLPCETATPPSPSVPSSFLSQDHPAHCPFDESSDPIRKKKKRPRIISQRYVVDSDDDDPTHVSAKNLDVSSYLCRPTITSQTLIKKSQQRPNLSAVPRPPPPLGSATYRSASYESRIQDAWSSHERSSKAPRKRYNGELFVLKLKGWPSRPAPAVGQTVDGIIPWECIAVGKVPPAPGWNPAPSRASASSGSRPRSPTRGDKSLHSPRRRLGPSSSGSNLATPHAPLSPNALPALPAPGSLVPGSTSTFSSTVATAHSRQHPEQYHPPRRLPMNHPPAGPYLKRKRPLDDDGFDSSASDTDDDDDSSQCSESLSERWAFLEPDLGKLRLFAEPGDIGPVGLSPDNEYDWADGADPREWNVPRPVSERRGMDLLAFGTPKVLEFRFDASRLPDLHAEMKRRAQKGAEKVRDVSVGFAQLKLREEARLAAVVLGGGEKKMEFGL